MSNVVDFPTQERRYDEASLWISRLDRGLSDAETQSLNVWIAEDSNNQIVLIKLAKLWDRMDRLTLLADVLQAQKVKKSKPLFWYATAASILVFALVLSVFWQINNIEVSARVTDGFYQTGIGEKQTIRLPDDSLLILNTDSQAKVVYTSHQRLIILNRGEIHIEVAHNVNRPLSVIAANNIVQAVGTAFDVHLFDTRKVSLLVTDGKVLVAERKMINNAASLDSINRLPATSVAVQKGQKILLGEGKQTVEEMDAIDINAQLSWRQGKIIFRGETLDEAVVEFNRYSDKKFIIKDDSLKSIRIAGVFKTGDTESLLRTLNNNFSIHYKNGELNEILLGVK